VREHFQLRSTYFSIIHNGDNITFKGKGFGHGVGLCQDGAMQMAKRGFNANDIIKYYYKGVRVVSFKELPFYQSILPTE
jgi:stage II sporulation protein D